MKKEDLIAMGLTEEQADKVMGSLDGKFVPKSRFNEINEENKTLKATVKERDKQLEDLKDAKGDVEGLKQQIADLQKANKEAAKAHEAEITQLKVDNAVEAALTAAGSMNNVAVKALLGDVLKDAKISDDGSILGLSDAIGKLKADDSSKFMFKVEQENNQQNFTGFQPGASGSSMPDDKVDVSKMTYSEMVEYQAQHPDAKLF